MNRKGRFINNIDIDKLKDELKKEIKKELLIELINIIKKEDTDIEDIDLQ